MAFMSAVALPCSDRADVFQFRNAVTSESSLLSFYPADGDSGSTLPDRKPPLQNGTMTGATFSTAAGTVGTLSINGARVVLGSRPEYEFSDGTGTVEAFLYQTGIAAFNPCFFAGRDDAASPATRYSLHGDTAGKNLYLWNGANVAIFPVPTNMINRLVHVAFVFKAGATTAYFNGRSLGTQSVGLGAGLGRPFQIGASGPANQEAWPGRIDEVAIYGDALSSNAVAAHYAAFLAQPNGLLREVYGDIPGVTVADLTQSPSFPDSPSSENLITDGFEAPSDVDDLYGQRLRAWLIPPATGDYTFWIAADDAAQLFLSTDDTPNSKRLIASVLSATGPREWTKDLSQQSVLISLTNGRRYYVEALMKEGAGNDHLSVRWQLPGGVIEEPIPASRTTPFGLTAPVVTAQPQDVTVDEGGSATFQVQVAHPAGITYQWQRNGLDVAGATNSTYTLAPVALADSESTFECQLANYVGTTNSHPATLTVNDITPPAVLEVARFGDGQTITILFSEPVEAATATNLTS